MIWQYVLTFFLNWGIDAAMAPSVNEPKFMDLAEGVYFKDLSPETIDLLHRCESYEKGRYNQRYDVPHFIYTVPMPDHKGHFYTVSFSLDYKILQITNDYSHS